MADYIFELPGQDGYTPGGGGVGGELPDPSSCGRDGDKICNCLGPILQRIGYANESIASVLREKLGNACDNLDKCTDKIIDSINAKYAKVVKTCEQCKYEVERGLANTLEHAITCAHCTCGDAEKTCSKEDNTTWGKPCKTCGEDCCTCEKGECVPGPCEDKPKAKYIGWCDGITKLAVVTKDDEPSPGPNYKQVSSADSQSEAYSKAFDICHDTKSPSPKPVPDNPTPPVYSTLNCNLGWYSSTSEVWQYLQGLPALGTLSDLLTYGDNLSTQVANAALDIGPAAALVKFGSKLYLNPLNIAAEFAGTISSAYGCPSESFVAGYKMLACTDFLNKKTGVDMSEFASPVMYAMHAACRQKWLDPDKAIAAYLAHSIEDPELDTLWSIHGYCPDALKWYKHAAKAKPVPRELSVLRRRKIIGETEYHDGMRQLGYLEPHTAENLYRLGEQLPTLADIIRLMVRDADDDQLARDIGLDDYFDKKYGTVLTEWAEQQGVPKQFIQYAWRAHWEIPSPSQLFTFWHRLRGEKKFEGKNGLLNDIKAALIQQDILPYWHEHYLATSYTPLGRVDIRRAYNIGTVKDDELLGLYVKIGYSDEDAARQVEFTKRLRRNSLPSHPAVKKWLRFSQTASEAVKELEADGFERDDIGKALETAAIGFLASVPVAAFIRGELNKQQLTDRLEKQGLPKSAIDKITDLAGLRITSHIALSELSAGMKDYNSARREMITDGIPEDATERLLMLASRRTALDHFLECQRGIKRRYMLGEIDYSEAMDELVKRGVSSGQATSIANAWSCARSTGSKALAAGKLCQLLDAGAINPSDFRDRLVKIGYTAEDAALMVYDCLGTITTKRRKADESATKKQVQESERARRALAAQQAAEKRATAQIDRKREAAERTRKGREKQAISAADKLHDKLGIDLSAAYDAVRDNKARVQREYGITIDRTLQILLLAVESMEMGDVADYETAVSFLAAASASEEFTEPELQDSTA